MLSQVACRVSAVVKFGAGAGEEPFAKVKKLFMDLIDRLQSEASPEASHRSYGDDELVKASEKRTDLETLVAGHSYKLETTISKTSALDGEVAELHAVLGANSHCFRNVFNNGPSSKSLTCL